MKTLFYILIIAFSCVTITFAQYYNTYQQHFGGNKQDYAANLVTTADSGYVVAGTTYSFKKEDGDFFVAKFNKRGNKQWIKTFSTPGYDDAKKIIAADAGGYVFTGEIYDRATNKTNILILRINDDGSTAWSKIIPESSASGVFNIIEGYDGNFLLLASLKSSSLIVNISSAGSVIWSKEIKADAIAFSVCKTGNREYALCGNYKNDVMMMKIDEAGSLKWARHLGSHDFFNNNSGTSVVSLSDGNIAFSGQCYINTIEENWDNVLIKVSQNGERIWSKRFGSDGSNTFDRNASLIENKKHELVLAGEFDSADTRVHGIFFVKFDKRGNFIQGTKIPFNFSYATASSIVESRYGHYLYAGTAEFEEGRYYGEKNDIHVAKLTSEPGVCGSYSYTVPYIKHYGIYKEISPDFTSPLIALSDIVLTEGKLFWQPVFTCTSDNVIAKTSAKEINAIESGLQLIAPSVYPNPARNIALVKFYSKQESKYQIQMSDLTGKILSGTQGMSKAGINNVTINVSKFTKGVYLVNLLQANSRKTVKLFVQ